MKKKKNIIHTNYMKDEDGNKYYTDKDKFNQLEKTWENVFRITEEITQTISIPTCRGHTLKEPVFTYGFHSGGSP